MGTVVTSCFVWALGFLGGSINLNKTKASVNAVLKANTTSKVESELGRITDFDRIGQRRRYVNVRSIG